MIVRLEIRNYAIIEKLSLEFSKGLNILTGETGSGKSIILGAFGLILGNRADSKVLFDKSKKCVVEATFDVRSYNLQPFFDEENLDYDHRTIIRREVNAAGKSRAFINDTPVNLKQLKRFGIRLVDLHQQFENQGINDPNVQIKMLDSLAGSLGLGEEYKQSYQAYRDLLRTKAALELEQQNAVKQQDFIAFQLDELRALNIDPERDGALELTLQQMDHAQEIMSGLSELVHVITERDQDLISTLSNLEQRLRDLSKYHVGIEAIVQRLESSRIELGDIAQEASLINDEMEVDEEALRHMRARMDKLSSLQYKHQVTNMEDLIKLQDKFEKELANYTSIEDSLHEIEREIETTRQTSSDLARKLSTQRKAAKPKFEKGVKELLGALKMEYAEFKITQERLEALGPNGLDQMEFLFAPNRGSGHRPIKEVASGGELSRLALITKSLVAESINLPTLIFDEIDSGVSGDVAQKMGHILQNLSADHQVISITHSPQVAARADSHFKVFKTLEDDATKAKILALSEDDRIVEIATMLSSSPPSAIALKSAKELIHSK